MISRNTLAILHFNPIELYPPVINLLNYLEEHFKSINVYVFTNNTTETIPAYKSLQKNIIIKRFGKIDMNFSVTKRLSNYFSYYYKTYSSLKKIHPEWLWYYESLSALPANWYFNNKKFKDTKLLIHYHEYTSPEEYKNDSLLNKWSHNAEKKLYNIVHCLSHTNEMRMQLFLKDNHISLEGKTFIFPNYPPKKWIRTERAKEIGFPIRMVYVGAIGMETLYIKEFCNWVNKQDGHVVFDIYSSQDTSGLQAFLLEEQCRFCAIKGYVSNENLPNVFSSYDVGVILYKGHIKNYIYNAPNKLFEYWACGLDVWFPEVMEGCFPFITTGIYPKIVPIDFDNIEKLDLRTVISRTGLSYKSSVYYCENIFESILQKGLGISL